METMLRRPRCRVNPAPARRIRKLCERIEEQERAVDRARAFDPAPDQPSSEDIARESMVDLEIALVDARVSLRQALRLTATILSEAYANLVDERLDAALAALHELRRVEAMIRAVSQSRRCVGSTLS